MATIDRQLLIDAHKGLERASECLRRDMLYLSTVKEARLECEKSTKKLLQLEEQLSSSEEKRPI